MSSDTAPSYVWSDSETEKRADYVMFRNTFNAYTGSTASIHVFTDSRYQLYVNGSMLNFGPTRFYPENPQYDTYDISEYLKAGKNVVAVKALSNGTYTYQVPLSKAGFIAWGEVQTDKKDAHDFSTPGNWVFRSFKGYDTDAPKMSFATGAMEIYDARRDPEEWLLPEFDDSGWFPVVKKKDQGYWGPLQARTIPPLTQEERSVKNMKGAYRLHRDEDMYSFRVKSADRTRADFGKNKYAFAYTYIYSPKKQTIPVGLWWGEYWLNGIGPLKGEGLKEGRPVRSDVQFELEEGWNELFIKYGIVWANWEFYMAIPKTAELKLSVNKAQDDEILFMTAGPFADEEEAIVRNLPLPFNTPADLPDLSAKWEPKARDDGAGNPAWEIAWSYFDRPLELKNEAGSTIIPGNTDAGIVYDMAQKTLGRFYLDVTSEPGTVIDIAFSEDLIAGRPWILKRPGIYTALRFITNGGHDRYESFKPYGARYIQVNVSGHKNPVSIHDIGMVSQTYHFEKTGSFICSDTMLNAIWELGWRTLVVCSEDSYTDTPFRERGLYAGDALPEYAITLAGSGDSRLMEHSIFLFSQMYTDLMDPGAQLQHASVNHMADYPLLTLLAYVWTFNRTGDKAFAEKYYEGYKNLMKHTSSWRMENGLLDHPKAFVEWTQIDKQATLTAVQSLAAYCYRSMAYVSRRLGKEDEDWFLKEERKTLDALHSLCWDEEHGAFRDGFRDGVPIDHHYPISSAWPTLFGQTTSEQETRLEVFYAEVLSDIGDQDRQRLATPYGGFYIIDALYRNGYTGTAERFMKKYWSPMILKHNDTAWENFGDGSDGSGQGTLSHAWSGGPTYHMTRHILGVDLGFPDFSSPDSIIFTPQSEIVDWARGSVPHSKGLIDIDWKLLNDTLIYQCGVPEGIDFKVTPKGRLADFALVVNGEIMK